MKINSQPPLIYDLGLRSSLPVDSAVNLSSNRLQIENTTQQVRPVAWAENLERARDYTLKSQATHEPLNQHSKAALSAYTSHDQNDERGYLTEVFGLDTFA